MKRCPQDYQTLEILVGQHGNAFRCRHCLGIWLPGSIVSAAIGRTVRANILNIGTLEVSRVCPEDNLFLCEQQYHGVKIDICKQCNGIWLDKGEYEELLRARSRIKEESSDALIQLADIPTTEIADVIDAHTGEGLGIIDDSLGLAIDAIGELLGSFIG